MAGKWQINITRWEKDLSIAGSIDLALIEFKLEKPIEPKDLKNFLEEVEIEKIKGTDLTLISGAGPIWLYGALLHRILHLTKAVAIYDPKLDKFIVVATHTANYDVGETIELKI